MSCAGCDDCPQDAWHLHVTVDRGGDNVHISATGFTIDMNQLGYRPVSVWNVMQGDPPDATYGDPRVRSYREWIPTQHFRGSEAKATYELFVMGHRLKNLGWIPRRLKIEGDARLVTSGRALYYEAHVKPKEPLSYVRTIRLNGEYLAISVSKESPIVTIRQSSLEELNHQFWLLSNVCDLRDVKRRVEACVLDTAPELDDEWLKSNGRGMLAT